MASDYQNKFWSSLKEMADALEKAKAWNGGGPNDSANSWKINEENTQIIGSFLKQWSVYLSPVYQIMAPLYMIPGWFVKMFYAFSAALEHVFNNIFALFGFFQNLEQNSFVGNVYTWLRIFGIAVFLLFVVVRIVMSWMGIAFKYKEFINHLILVTASVSLLPQALISFSSMWAGASSKLLATSTNKDGETNQSLSIQPIQDNITDVMQLVKYNFDAEKLGREAKDNGYINPSKLKGVQLNTINDKNVYALDFTKTYGATDKETLDYFADKSGDNPNYYGLAAVFHSALDSFEYDKKGNPELVVVQGYKSKGFLEAYNNLNIKTYLRYRVNWITLYVQQVMLILLLIGLLLNTIQAIYRVLLSAVVAPIVGYTSVDDSSKFLDLLQSIFAGIAGIWFEILIVKYGLWFITASRTVSLKGFGSFMDGLGFFENAIASAALYIGVFIATAQGSRAIENWLGIQTGSKNGMMQAAGAAYAAHRVSRSVPNSLFGKYDTRTGKRHGGLMGNKTAALNRATDFGGRAIRGAGSKITRGAGAMAGVYQGTKEQGFGAAARALTSNMREGGNKSGFINPVQSAKENYNRGKEKGYGLFPKGNESANSGSQLDALSHNNSGHANAEWQPASPNNSKKNPEPAESKKDKLDKLGKRKEKKL